MSGSNNYASAEQTSSSFAKYGQSNSADVTQLSCKLASLKMPPDTNLVKQAEPSLAHLNEGNEKEVEVTKECLEAALSKLKLQKARPNIIIPQFLVVVGTDSEVAILPRAHAGIAGLSRVALPSHLALIGPWVISLPQLRAIADAGQDFTPSQAITIAGPSTRCTRTQQGGQLSKAKLRYNPQNNEFPVLGCPMCARLWTEMEDWMTMWNLSGEWQVSSSEEARKEVEQHMAVHKVRVELEMINMDN